MTNWLILCWMFAYVSTSELLRSYTIRSACNTGLGASDVPELACIRLCHIYFWCFFHQRPARHRFWCRIKRSDFQNPPTWFHVTFSPNHISFNSFISAFIYLYIQLILCGYGWTNTHIDWKSSLTNIGFCHI